LATGERMKTTRNSMSAGGTSGRLARSQAMARGRGERPSACGEAGRLECEQVGVRAGTHTRTDNLRAHALALANAPTYESPFAHEGARACTCTACSRVGEDRGLGLGERLPAAQPPAAAQPARPLPVAAPRFHREQRGESGVGLGSGFGLREHNGDQMITPKVPQSAVPCRALWL
jgi:hypothetical protein